MRNLTRRRQDLPTFIRLSHYFKLLHYFNYIQVLSCEWPYEQLGLKPLFLCIFLMCVGAIMG